MSNDQADLEQILSDAFGRDIAFVEARAEGMTSGVAEEYWPDMAGLEHRDTVTDFEMPVGGCQLLCLRREVLLVRAEVRDLCRLRVAAGGWS